MAASSIEIQKQKQLRLEVTTKNFIQAESKAAKDLLRKIRSEVAEEDQAMDQILSKIDDEATCGLFIEYATDIHDLASELPHPSFNSLDHIPTLFLTCTTA